MRWNNLGLFDSGSRATANWALAGVDAVTEEKNKIVCVNGMIVIRIVNQFLPTTLLRSVEATLFSYRLTETELSDLFTFEQLVTTTKRPSNKSSSGYDLIRWSFKKKMY